MGLVGMVWWEVRANPVPDHLVDCAADAPEAGGFTVDVRHGVCLMRRKVVVSLLRDECRRGAC